MAGVLVGLVASLLSACWPMPGAGPDRRSFNPYERELTVGTVARLTEAFRIPLGHGVGAPVVTRAGLLLRDHVSISSFDPSTGASRWTTRVPPAEIPQDEIFTVSDPYVLKDDQHVLASATAPGLGGQTFGGGVMLAADSGEVEQPMVGSSWDIGSVRGRIVTSIKYDRIPQLQQFFRSIEVTNLDSGERWGG